MKTYLFQNIYNLLGEQEPIRLHIGPRANYIEGWINIDKNACNDEQKLIFDFDIGTPLPFEENSVDIIYDEELFDRVLQESVNAESLLNNYRHILKTTGLMKIKVTESVQQEILERLLNEFGFDNIDFIKISTENATLTDYMIMNEDLFPMVTEDIVVVDDLFPQIYPNGFRNMEISTLMAELDNFKSYTIPRITRKHIFCSHPHGVSEERFNENKEGYLQIYPQNENKIKYLSLYQKYNFKLAYSYFLFLTYQMLPVFEKNAIPFVFTLYPGGDFGLDNANSDFMLREIFNSKFFRKVIVTQRTTLKYLISKNLCPETKIEYLYGGYLQFNKRESLPKKFYPTNKSTFDICFVACKYTPRGIDKGYDLFIETAKKIASKYHYARFHIVGGFNENDIDVTEIKDVITFYGHKAPEFLKEFYSNMDVCISPSRPFKIYPGNFNGFPLGSDAMSCQTALFVADEVNENTHFLDGEDLVIIKADVEDISKKVEFYMDNLALLYKLSKKGQDKIYEIMDPQVRVRKVKDILIRESGLIS